MAVDHLGSISAELIRKGRDASTPVALIQDGTTRRQRVVTSTLECAASDAARYGIRPPAVLVVGQVVGLRQELGRLGLAAPEAPAVPGARISPPGLLEPCAQQGAA
jgi:siroheme synthase